MPKYTASGRAAAVPTALRGPHLIGNDSDSFFGDLIILEVGVFNASTTAQAIALRRTSGGTSGADVTESKLDKNNARAAQAQAKQTHTADATGSDEIVRCQLGAALGSAMIWSFDDGEFVVEAASTPQQIAIVAPEGGGALIDFYFKWREG